ncbi:MAG: stage 0 sporulation protein [Candidatus Coatesbacteria bacterium]|nr:stage 0 sporulation protein [Candidatus Coatesbacteria bacterium]
MVIVRFPGHHRQKYNDPFQIRPFPGEWVIVEADKGEDIGEVICTIECNDNNELPNITRLANSNDLNQARKNKSRQREAWLFCNERISELKLDMKLVDVIYQLDSHKITFFFIAPERIDFRQLVRDLAARFRTRIELKQIGVRDAAKRFGGFGTCGRELCCCRFLTQFTSVTVKMSKDQNLSANSSKISGVCGRLMCCLGYESDFYSEARELFPDNNTIIKLGKKTYWVLQSNYFNETILMQTEEGEQLTISLQEYKKIDSEFITKPEIKTEEEIESEYDLE